MAEGGGDVGHGKTKRRKSARNLGATDSLDGYLPAEPEVDANVGDVDRDDEEDEENQVSDGINDQTNDSTGDRVSGQPNNTADD